MSVGGKYNDKMTKYYSVPFWNVSLKSLERYFKEALVKEQLVSADRMGPWWLTRDLGERGGGPNMEVLHNTDLTEHHSELNVFIWILNVMQVSVTDDRQIMSVISH